jgi:hypothetical protein
MKKLLLSSRKYNYHDPKSKMILETDKNDIKGSQVFIHLTVGQSYVDDTETRREWLTMIGQLHGVEVIYHDNDNSI